MTDNTSEAQAVTPDVILPHNENMIRADIWNELGHDKQLGKALATYGWRRFSSLVGSVIARHRIQSEGRTGAGEALREEFAKWLASEGYGRAVIELDKTGGYEMTLIDADFVAALSQSTEKDQ